MNTISKQKKLQTNVSVSEWDIIKGIAALGLPFVNVILTFILCEQISDTTMSFCNLILVLTVFGPSVFMICMGIKLQKTDDPNLLLRYGKGMLFIALLLNLLRTIIPSILVVAVVGSSVDHLVSYLFLSDIYQFVGLFYILLALFRKAKISLAGITVISLLMLTANCLLGGLVKTGNETVNAIIGNIVYVDQDSVFPLLSWTVFPVFGMLVGKVLENKTQKEIDKICIHTLWISATVLALTVIGLYHTGISAVQIAVSPLNDNKTGPLNIVLVLCINLISIVFVRFLARIIRAEKIKRWLGWMSTNLVIFYFLHWCILTLISYPVAAVLELSGKTAGIGLLLILSVAVDVVTIIIVNKFGFSIIKRIFKVVRI